MINANVGSFGDTKSTEINMPQNGDTDAGLQYRGDKIHRVE